MFMLFTGGVPTEQVRRGCLRASTQLFEGKLTPLCPFVLAV